MDEKKTKVLKSIRPWRDAFYYQKAEALYQLTYVFCQRFLPQHGDRIKVESRSVCMQLALLTVGSKMLS